MKIRTIILWTIVLVVIEQVIKLVISTSCRDINIELIPSLLAFKPTLNNKSFYWLSLMGIDVGRWARLAIGTTCLGILSLFYFFYFPIKTILKKEKWIDAGFIFGFAGTLCSLCDNLFFGGSWDYVYLKPLFVFDMKDLYMNCFIILILVFFSQNMAKIKRILSLLPKIAKNRTKTRKI